MNGILLVLRAVSVEFARRIYVPIVIIAAIIGVIAIILSIWLTAMSAWWWILVVIVFLGVIIAGVILGVIAIIMNVANPKQTRAQKIDVKMFVDKLQGLSEITQTPKFILLFRIVKDIVAPKEDGFVKKTIGNTLSLRKDFETLRNSFK